MADRADGALAADLRRAGELTTKLAELATTADRLLEASRQFNLAD